MTKTRVFRQDINGLRAWAVVAVVLFHFQVPGFSGGFVGVDIFFVISGYLMLGIIARGLIQNQRIAQGLGGKPFSIVGFYLARARRILPALLALCLFLLIVGWFYLPAPNFENLGKHTISAVNFFSNIRFYREDGYFDTLSHEKLLLHTWSLSVEWQFYLLLPLLLSAMWRIRSSKSMLLVTTLICFVASLAFSIYLSAKSPSAAFYLLPTRAWQMLAGGLVYLLAERLIINSFKQRLLEAFGFVLIILSVVIFDAQSNWPGWRALVPVLGTVCVLIAARQGSLWTNTLIAQRFGDWSYSLYLWHWPLAVALVYLNRIGEWQATIICLAMTVILGWLSYQYIETPSRYKLNQLSSAKGFVVIAAAVLALVLPSSYIRQANGIPERIPAEVTAILAEADNKNPRRDECHNKLDDNCHYGGDKLGVIVLGDSHGQSLVRSVEKSLPNNNLYALDWTVSGCLIAKNLQRVNPDKDANLCAKFVDMKLSESKQLDPSVPMIIINRISQYTVGYNEPDEIDEPTVFINTSYQKDPDLFLAEMRESIVDTACQFAKTRPVYMLRPIPELKLHVPNTMARALWYSKKNQEVTISLDEYTNRQAAAWAIQDEAAERCGIKILDPLPYLCTDDHCMGDNKGLPIYYDDDHLNERGGQLLLPLLKTMYSNRDINKEY